MRTVFINAVFHTMESAADTHRSMIVEDGHIVAFDEPASSGDTVVDLGGAHVFPAMTDAHLHMSDTIGLAGISTQVCRVEGDRIEPHDLSGVAEIVRRAAADAKPGSLLVFSNYITAGIAEDRLPNATELDEWAGAGREVWVLNIDGHSSACSTALLQALGLQDAAPDGILRGANHDANLGRMSDHVAGSITPALLGDGIAAFCDECASYGIGCVCALDGCDDSQKDAMTFLFARLAQRFPLDVRWFPQYMDPVKLQRAQRFLGRPRVGGCMKWELDGSIGSRSAAMREPFQDGSKGHLYFSDDELRQCVSDLDAQGMQITAHAIGELAIEQLMGIYEELDSSDGCVQPGGHRIDHCEFPAPEVVERLCALKPFVTVQPGYAWFDKRFMRGYEQWLNPQQIAQQVPLRTLSEAGVPLCGSSDSPVQSVDPFLQMRGMREFYVEDESLDAFEALKTYTVNAGLMLDEPRGILRPGYYADFFCIDCDLLTIPPHGLDGLHASALYLRGKQYTPMTRGISGLLKLFGNKRRAL